MNPNAPAALTVSELKKKIAEERDRGALIYIKRTDSNGVPLNLQLNGNRAVSGKWTVNLKVRPIVWMLIYHRIKPNFGQVWVGDYDRVESVGGGRHAFYLSNVRGPTSIAESVRTLLNLRAPQHPIYLSPKASQKSKEGVAARQLAVDLTTTLSKSTTGVTPSEVEQLVLARLGQGHFRKLVLAQWGGSCAVTGCKMVEAIRASHIRPWCDSDDYERLNPHNGLPLIANLDALFDRGLITFTSTGEMIVSTQMGETERDILGVPARLRRPPHQNQLKFLHFHQVHIFRP